MLGLIGEAISLRSFSSLWYWAALAAFWVYATGRILGISFNLVRRAQGGGDALELLEVLAHAQAQHWVAAWSRWQILWVAGGFALLAGLSSLAFSYGLELAQALWFFVVPALGLMALQLRLALRIARDDLRADGLISLMYRTRIALQLIGFASIFVTAVFAFLALLIHGYFR